MIIILTILVLSVIIILLIVNCFNNKSNFKNNINNVIKIPKIINKIYISHDEKLPNFPLKPYELQKAHDSWINKNKEYKLQYWDTKKCKEYLIKNFSKEHLDTFNCINAYSGKCNFFRYCVIYNEGGWYSDWKQVCLEDNLLNYLSNNKDLIVFKDTEKFNPQLKGCIQPAFFGAIKNHSLLLQAINNCILNVKNKNYSKNVWYTTGPCLFGTSFKQLNLSNKLLIGSYSHPQNAFILNNGKKILLHKCKNCGLNQDWNNGNNYIDLYNKKKYYC